MSMTEDIAVFVASFGLKSAPPELLPKVREAFLDSLGVMLAGGREESSQLVARWVQMQAATGPCSVFAQEGLRTSAANAALANGVAAHTLDFDHFGHQSAVIAPCVLALGEARAINGLQLLESYIVGVEVSTLLASAIGKEAHDMGLHPAGLSGTLGAAAAAARILKLTTGQAQTALGIAASLTGGLNQNFGTMVKPLHLGNAARNGIMAAELAAGGFTANLNILDQHGGFFSALMPQAMAKNLGAIFRFIEPGIAFKAYPCPYSSQRAVDAIIKIVERHQITAQEITEITCAAAPKTFRVLIHHRPSTSLEAKFSLEFLLAAGLVFHGISEECFDLKHVSDPLVRGLVEKVRLIDAPLERGTPGEGPVTVQVKTRDTMFEETVTYAPGHPKNPLSWDKLAAKYRACGRQGGIGDAAIERSLNLLSRIEEVEDVREVDRSLQW